MYEDSIRNKINMIGAYLILYYDINDEKTAKLICIYLLPHGSCQSVYKLVITCDLGVTKLTRPITIPYLVRVGILKLCYMMTSSNGNIFRVTAICAGNSPVPGEFPTQRPVMRSFDVYFDLRPNKRLNKQSLDWWFETLSPPIMTSL